MKTYDTLIFDLDNTLCNCAVYYDTRKDIFAKMQSDRTGLSANLCMDLLNHIDSTFQRTKAGFSRDRFPRSFAATSVALDIMLGNDIDEDESERSYFLADSVFNESYPLYDGVYEMLMAYKNDGYNLLLITKGDYSVQSRKLDINRLYDIFEKDKIYIDTQKYKEHFERAIDDHNIKMSTTLIVGDSMKDDVGSGNLLGVDTLLVKTGWGYEDPANERYKPTYTINSIIDLHKIVPLFGVQTTYRGTQDSEESVLFIR